MHTHTFSNSKFCSFIHFCCSSKELSHYVSIVRCMPVFIPVLTNLKHWASICMQVRAPWKIKLRALNFWIVSTKFAMPDPRHNLKGMHSFVHLLPSAVQVLRCSKIFFLFVIFYWNCFWQFAACLSYCIKALKETCPLQT